MNVGDKVILKIEKMVNLGLGLAYHEGCVVFVNQACTEDVVEAVITYVSKKHINADIVKIIVPSKYRIEPVCKNYNTCGACQLLHIDYNYQLEIKHDFVKKELACFPVDVHAVVPCTALQHCRNKVQYAVRCAYDEIKIGYYEQKTHNIIDVDECGIQKKRCEDIIRYLKNSMTQYNLTTYSDNTNDGLVRNVMIRSSDYNEQHLVVIVVNSTHISSKLRTFCLSIFNAFDDVCGVCVNFNTKRNNVILGDITELVCGEKFVLEEICGVLFKIGPTTFFQVSPQSARNMFGFVKDQVKSRHKNATVLDAYAGITAFGFILSGVCEKVVSVESNVESVKLAHDVKQLNSIDNVELFCMDAGKFFEQEVKRKNKYDVVLLDPPRKGCSQESLDSALALTKSDIIYVSCNPSTLARDLKYLTNNGMIIECIQPFDMFCHTYHVETVVVLRKS